MKKANLRAVTKQYDFFNATPDGDKLFSVRGGIPLDSAFDQLAVFIASAQSVVESAGIDESTPKWAASQLLDVAYALTHAMHNGLMEHEKATGVNGGAL